VIKLSRIDCLLLSFARVRPPVTDFASASSDLPQHSLLRRRAAGTRALRRRAARKTMAGVKAVIRLRCPAGVAKPGPAIGQALGPHGLNMMDFVKEFNAATQKMEPNSPIPVVLTAYANRTFSFVTKTPPTSYLVRKALGIDKGAQNPGDEVVGTLTREQVSAIAEVKQGDAHLANIPFEALCDSVVGTARSMGVLLADDVDDASSSSSSSDEDDDGEPGR
jgi:large subunit ribosomal protein L11